MHGIFKAGFQGMFRSPAQFPFYLGRTDGIAQIMARSVRDKGYGVFVRSFRQRREFIKHGATTEKVTK